MNRSIHNLLRLTLVACFALALNVRATDETAAAKDQKSFESPDAAFKALLESYEKGTDDAVLDILGHQHKDFIVQTDQEASHTIRKKLFDLAKEHLRIVTDGAQAYAYLGIKDWPYPIPMVKQGEHWIFDTAAGKEEILNRRVGHNELAAIKFCDAYLDAQRKYASEDHTGDKVLKYAQKIISTKDKKDGLIWDDAPGAAGAISPLEATLDRQEFQDGNGTDIPYHGYYFKILTKQGPKPPNGKYDYVINGNMIAGFALVAWPADYGTSGIMTFTISHQGTIYQKNLGQDTAKHATAMEEYNPDETWTEVTP